MTKECILVYFANELLLRLLLHHLNTVCNKEGYIERSDLQKKIFGVIV